MLCIQQCIPFSILEGIRTPPKGVACTSKSMTWYLLKTAILDICKSMGCQYFATTKVKTSKKFKEINCHLKITWCDDSYITLNILSIKIQLTFTASLIGRQKSCSFSQCLDYDRQHSWVCTKTWIYNIIKWSKCASDWHVLGGKLS